MKKISIGWVFQFCIFIDQEVSFLWIFGKTRLKSAVSNVTALISLFCKMNKVGR